MTNPKDEDPELFDIDELRRIEKTRHRSRQHRLTGTLILIVLAMLVLVLLAGASLWIIAKV